MNKYDKIIFVCSNDTCRAPMAAGIMKNKFLHSPSIIESRGLVVLFQSPINPKVEAIMMSNGMSLKDHQSSQLLEEDFSIDNLIVVMNEEDRQTIFKEFANAKNVYLISELAGEEGDVYDPYGKALADYGKCYEELDNYITKFVKKLNEEVPENGKSLFPQADSE